MPKYVVISNHPPNSCPSANAILRKRGENLGVDIPPLMKKHAIKADSMLHLDPGHRVLWVLDAPNAEAVRDMIYESGLGQWNDFEFYMASTLEWITNKVREMQTIW